MAQIAAKPWHQVVTLREELRSGDMSQNTFAADLYDVVMGRAQRIYQNPADFFALTYPTLALRNLARDIAQRLSGLGDKAVRQLDLTYGGGKTHTLITLYHLAKSPAELPLQLPAVQEFISHIGLRELPQARIAVLPFDKLDVEKGMDITSPDGSQRTLLQPWSVLAYQLAGDAGLSLLHPEDRPEERRSAPSEDLLTQLLMLPAKENLATLILIDEAMMYAREKVRIDPDWQSVLATFFQYLTQAAVKVPRCAIVASLLATDPSKDDDIGKSIKLALSDVFNREREEIIQPVQKEDVAEVLRRRFFTPESIRDPQVFGPHVVAAVDGITHLDDTTLKNRQAEESRFRSSYPFHPELTEVLYSKWTNVQGFQRTRGVLRTFALAMRDAIAWDASILISANIFLSKPGSRDLSAGANELASIARTGVTEGNQQNWGAILEGEFDKARAVQHDHQRLKNREIEQAVFATFLHSQPIGQHAGTRDLMLLLGSSGPDRIELEKALEDWTQRSWFLDESEFALKEQRSDGTAGLPRHWRMGSRPNLRQMQHEVKQRLSEDTVESRLEQEIQKYKYLTAETATLGAKVHILPKSPADIPDDGEFRFVILGPSAASRPGSASVEATRYINETTGSDRPRVNRNSIVLAVPSRDELEGARDAVRDYLAWESVRELVTKQNEDKSRLDTLDRNLKIAQERIPGAIQRAYTLAVALPVKENDVTAFKIALDSGSLFRAIKIDRRLNIQDQVITAEALLPEGPYGLWQRGETRRWIKDIVGAFSTNPKLPRMLKRQAIYDTLAQSCRDGLLVFTLRRPDSTVRTFWREQISDDMMHESALEAHLPDHVSLDSIAATLLLPGQLPGLWSGDALAMRDLASYFNGQHRVGDYSEIAIPKAECTTIETAIRTAVQTGKLWFIVANTGFCNEPIPEGLDLTNAIVREPPTDITYQTILPPALPAAWSTTKTTARDISDALSQNSALPLPWPIVRTAIGQAITMNQIEVASAPATWPCDSIHAESAELRLRTYQHSAATSSGAAPYSIHEAPVEPVHMPISGKVAQTTLQPSELQDLADAIGELKTLATPYGIDISVTLRCGNEEAMPEDVVTAINEILGTIRGGWKLE